MPINPEDMRVMNAAQYEVQRLGQFRGSAIIEPKYDGIRAQCYILGDEHHNVEFYTRNGNELFALHGLREEMAQFGGLFCPLVLDGEAIIKDAHFSEGAGLLRRKYEIANDAHFIVFDIANLDPATPWFERREFLEGLTWTERCYLAPYAPVLDDSQAQKAFKQYVLQGYEGGMVKDSKSLYMNRRHWSWMKMKTEETFEVQIKGIFEGKGKYVGTLGGFLGEMKDGGKARVGGGFSDAERDLFWQMWHSDRRSELQDTWMECTGQLKTRKGSIRHPNYVRLRIDI